MSSRTDYMIYRQGKLCGDKIKYKDGVGCCVWYPMVLEDDPDDLGSGICFDFSGDDLDDFISLLIRLKNAEPDLYIEEEGEKKNDGSDDDANSEH